jgi:hypothetical protein
MPNKLLPWIAQVDTHMQLSRITHPEHCLLVATEYANDFNNLVLKLPEMTEDEKIYSFISGLRTEVKLQVELHRPNDLQTVKEIAEPSRYHYFPG